MNFSRENIGLWVTQSEPDYFLFFIKVWIPFNAWYVAEYPDLNKNDKEIIKELQDSQVSKPRRIIENLLTKKDYEALTFQSCLAELHYYLEKNELIHNEKKLSFTHLSLTNNPVLYKNFHDEFGNVYKVEKKTSHFQAYIEAKGGKVLLDFKPPKYDIDGLQKDTDFIRLDSKLQQKIVQLFGDINPSKPISLLHKRENKSSFTLLKSKHSYKFINDKTIIAKGCLKVLYLLRCMLFHGEVSPTKTNKPIYENAYFLLRLIIKGFE